MILTRKIKFFAQSAATILVVALAAVGVAQGTTIGTNISASGTLTVAGATTLQAAATITSTSNPQLTAQYDSLNYWTAGVSSTGAVTFARYGDTLQNGFTFADTLNVATSTTKTILTVESSNTSNATTTLAVYQAGTGDILNLYDSATAVFTVRDGGRVGVASSTPSGLLSVEQSTETNSFVVGNTGSSTPSFIIKGVNGNGRVGIATTSPTAMFAVGNSGSATTTFDFSKPCFRMEINDGGTLSTLYYWPSLAAGVQGGWATSTTSCY